MLSLHPARVAFRAVRSASVSRADSDSMPPRDQIVFGAALALVAAAVLAAARWIVDETPKGRRLAERFGRPGAALLVRGLALAFLALGVLLATGIVNPIRW